MIKKNILNLRSKILEKKLYYQLSFQEVENKILYTISNRKINKLKGFLMKYLLCILFYYLINIPTYAQQATNWQNYTDMKNVQAVFPVSGEIWAATSGGGFVYNYNSNSFKTLHRADGMTGQNLTAVTVDKYGKIWFGSSDGAIDIYDPSNNSVKSILDIYISDKASKQINELTASGDTIIASTDYGISLINTNNLTFYDTFFRFGNFSSNIQVNNVIKSNLLYASTVSGVAIQKKGTTNLSAPESWNVYSSADGLPSNNINRIILFNNSLIAATDKGLATLVDTSWQTYIPSLSGNNINDLLTVGDTLYILTNNNAIYAYSNNNLNEKYNLSLPATKIVYSSSLGLLAATSNGILKLSNASGNDFIYPNGPETNQFPSMAVDNNGVLWCGSGSDQTGQGFYKFDGHTWTNYSTSTDTNLLSNFFFVVYAAPDNSVDLGSWGRGYINIKDNNISNYYINNTGMKGTNDNTDASFLVITGFAADSKNNLWVLNFGSVDEKPLNMVTPDDTWYYYSMPAAPQQYVKGYLNLTIDQYDTKWFTNNTLKPGLYYYNENKTYNDLSDDSYGYLSTSNGLNTNTINSLVVDLRGDLWVGTSLGVNIISNTDAVLNGSGSQLSISSVFTLRQQSINCIAVDPINDKWIGTNQGLLLVNSDGSSLLASYNTQNSPLLSDIITSIAVDKNTGTVYVGTNNGLTSFQTPAIQPQASFTKLFMYPSPFVLKNGVNKLTIDGLIKDSQIKIISITGKLIKEFASPGGKIAYWDGTDTNGNLVNSGIYLVVAYDADGNNVFTGKIAVLHQ